MNSVKKEQKNLEVIKIDETKKDPLPGEPGHWRNEKDKKVTKGQTTTDTIKKAGLSEKEESKKVVNVKAAFKKEEAKKLNRDDQEMILKNRGVKFSSKDNELSLINKIVSSNPKK